MSALIKRFIITVVFFFASSVSTFACPDDPRLLFINCSIVEMAIIVALDAEMLAPEASEAQLIVTGTYSSADRFGIEGLAIIDGKQVSSRFQGWDGLLAITPDGKTSIHNVARAAFGNVQYNLRDADQRAAFITYAGDQGLSAIQSHLLVSDGEVDVRDRPKQPRFQRRIAFITNAGDFGLFDSGASITLYQAAVILHDEFDANMAFNLDMGAYDYCMRGDESCGRLRQQDTDILTNILIFSY